MSDTATKNSIAVIVDSGTGLTKEFIEEHGIYVVPILMTLPDGTTKRSGLDITPEEMEKVVRESTDVKTASPSPESVMEAVSQAFHDGYDQALVVTISSGLSSTYDVACLVSGILAEKDSIQLEVVDTLNIGAASGLVAQEAMELIENGVPFDKLGLRLAGVAGRTKVWFTVKDLGYLRRGGRISEPVYRMGSLLSIKPVITCDETGHYVVAKKVRGWDSSVKAEQNLALQFASTFSRVRVAICASSTTQEEADAMEQEVRDELGDMGVDIMSVDRVTFPPELFVHTGPDALGIAIQGDSL